MRSSTTQALLERIVPGDRCEAKGCYELAVWLVSCNGTVSHWCPKHTRMQMSDVSRWDDSSKSRVRGERTATRAGEIR